MSLFVSTTSSSSSSSLSLDSSFWSCGLVSVLVGVMVFTSGVVGEVVVGSTAVVVVDGEVEVIASTVMVSPRVVGEVIEVVGATVAGGVVVGSSVARAARGSD